MTANQEHLHYMTPDQEVVHHLETPKAPVRPRPPRPRICVVRDEGVDEHTANVQRQQQSNEQSNMADIKKKLFIK